MYKKLCLAALLAGTTLLAQNPSRERKEKNPVLHEVSNKDIVQSIYPEAVKVEKINDYWFRILSDKNKILGFAMSSVSYCKDIIGYNNLTPVMILVDKKKVIKKVALQTNWETARFVNKLEQKGFFDLWVGKTLKEARNLQVDARTGATYTAQAVSKNVDFLLNNATKRLPM
ncbi:MAG: FMN-binding protein [Paludibacter sp.]